MMIWTLEQVQTVSVHASKEGLCVSQRAPAGHELMVQLPLGARSSRLPGHRDVTVRRLGDGTLPGPSAEEPLFEVGAGTELGEIFLAMVLSGELR